MVWIKSFIGRAKAPDTKESAELDMIKFRVESILKGSYVDDVNGFSVDIHRFLIPSAVDAIVGNKISPTAAVDIFLEAAKKVYAGCYADLKISMQTPGLDGWKVAERNAALRSTGLASESVHDEKGELTMLGKNLLNVLDRIINDLFFYGAKIEDDVCARFDMTLDEMFENGITASDLIKNQTLRLIRLCLSNSEVFGSVEKIMKLSLSEQAKRHAKFSENSGAASATEADMRRYIKTLSNLFSSTTGTPSIEYLLSVVDETVHERNLNARLHRWISSHEIFAPIRNEESTADVIPNDENKVVEKKGDEERSVEEVLGVHDAIMREFGGFHTNNTGD